MNAKKYSSNKERFFSFSLSQKRGIFVLLCLIFLLLMGILIVSSLDSQTAKYDFTEFEEQIALYEDDLIKSQNSNKEEFNFINVNNSFQTIHLTPFHFNPNSLSVEEWRELGLKEYQIKSIQRYLSKGGVFRKKEDFKKMYCLSEQEYRILEPYINIPSSSKNISSTNIASKKVFQIELNSADTTDLKQLNGIGTTFANRIVKYRTLLGGFHSKNQLLEVWGFSAEMLEKIMDFSTLDVSLIKQININTTTLDQLKKHPYIDYYLAKNIIKYRTDNGNFKSIDELLKVTLLYEDVFEKIKPYLIVQ